VRRLERGVVFAAMLALATLAHGPARADDAPAPAPTDSLALFLKALGDSTDATYGQTSVAFDTTGLDSLAEGALAHPPNIRRRGHSGALSPVVRFHRAEGQVAGLATRVGAPRTGWLGLAGAYAFGNHEGRYAFDYRRTLFASRPTPLGERGRPGVLGTGVTRLDFTARYERTTTPFMPEHSAMGLSSIDALWTGDSRQSVFERRGVTAGLTLWTGDFRLDAGVRDAVDEPMPLATRWSVFGDRDGVPVNALAAHDRFTEPWGSVAFARADWQLTGALDAEGGGADRWRLHGALGKGLRLGRSVKAALQVEAGAAASLAPPQRRFELGGGLALPSLPRGTSDTDHLLVGKLELVGSQDVLRGVGIHPPDWLVLQPLVFAQAGAAWDDVDARDVVFARPPRTAWKGSAGAGLAYRIGIPDPGTFAKLFVAWPVGRDAGVARLNLAVGTTFDLVGRR
jgi:hypothetical protein